MSRISDIGNKDISELKQVVRDMALRINQLERMLNNQDLYEVMVQDGVLYQRKVRLSLNNGLTRDSFVPVSVIGDDDGTGGMDWTKVAFGYKLDPDGDDPLEVHIYAGQVDKIAVSAATLDLFNGECVYLQHDLATNAITIEQGTSFPTDSEDYKYTRLYLFELNEDFTAAELKNIYRAMDIEGEALPTGEDGQLVQVNADGILECNWGRMKNIT